MPGFLLFLAAGREAVCASAPAASIMPRPARRARVARRYRVLPADARTPPHTPTLDIFFTVLIFLRSRTGHGKKPREAVVHTTHALERSESPAASFPRPPHDQLRGPGQVGIRRWTETGRSGLGWMPRAQGRIGSRQRFAPFLSWTRKRRGGPAERPLGNDTTGRLSTGDWRLGSDGTWAEGFATGVQEKRRLMGT
jgi:hypothetical protein